MLKVGQSTIREQYTYMVVLTCWSVKNPGNDPNVVLVGKNVVRKYLCNLTVLRKGIVNFTDSNVYICPSEGM